MASEHFNIGGSLRTGIRGGKKYRSRRKRVSNLQVLRLNEPDEKPVHGKADAWSA